MGKKSNGKGRAPKEADRLLGRRSECLRRWLSGETQQAIGDSLGISKQLVGLDCRLALKEWRATHRASINESAEFEWDLLNWVQLEAQRQYEMSQSPKERKNLGDPRYFDIIMKAGEHRRKLFGIDKPTKIEAQTTAELSVSTTFKSLDEMKATIAKRVETLRIRKSESAQ